jgi:hypothetical protein
MAISSSFKYQQPDFQTKVGWLTNWLMTTALTPESAGSPWDLGSADSRLPDLLNAWVLLIIVNP